jgi:hypothetical protein
MYQRIGKCLILIDAAILFTQKIRGIHAHIALWDKTFPHTRAVLTRAGLTVYVPFGQCDR